MGSRRFEFPVLFRSSAFIRVHLRLILRLSSAQDGKGFNKLGARGLTPAKAQWRGEGVLWPFRSWRVSDLEFQPFGSGDSGECQRKGLSVSGGRKVAKETGEPGGIPRFLDGFGHDEFLPKHVNDLDGDRHVLIA